VVLIYQNPVQVGIGLLIVAAVGIGIYFFALPKGQAIERLVAEHAAERVGEGPIHTVDL